MKYHVEGFTLPILFLNIMSFTTGNSDDLMRSRQ